MKLQTALDTALAAVDGVPAEEVPRSLNARLDALAAVQELRNRLDALANDLMVAVAHSADPEPEDARETFVGRLALGSQAPELIAPSLGVSVQVATRRVVTAVELADRAPALLEEMRAGRLDGFRAGLVHAELADAPVHVEEQVVACLVDRADRAGAWTESAGPLTRRVRALLTKMAPDVIAARAAADRDRRGLHRFGESEHLDRWDGLYLVDDARLAWAAIDERARELLAADRDAKAEGGVGTLTLAQARADAHLELLLGHADVTLHVHAAQPAGMPLNAAPATSSTPAPAEPGIVPLAGFGGPGSTPVRRSWLEAAYASGRAVVDAPIACHPTTGAVVSGQIAKGFTRGERRPTQEAAPRYRIPEAMARLVRFRDRQCRFPNCAVSARFCDLDHVRPWPDGPTSAANLMCLCRRHHRLKQSPGWRVTIHPDATVTWTDPVGRRHTSEPVDHLGVLDHPLTAASDPSPLESSLSVALAA